MRGVGMGAVRGDVVRLFEGESVAGLGEGELLGRFADLGDPAAFEALVTRLGPMVLGVCRRMLADPHDVDDAFQATFLVLVKKAGSIRERDLVGPWLYGVALRVARRARVESNRRKARERGVSASEAVEPRVELESGWLELRALIDEEIGRLPEAHRRAVVLCDVEGLSREEAALRLGWTLNMVRGRLERARGRLRNRLARRGVAPTGAWAALMVAPATPSPALLAATVRASLAFSVGQIGRELASASAVALAQGVSRMMMLSKWKLSLAVVISVGFVAGGSGMLAAQGPGNKPGADVKPADVPVASPAQEPALQPLMTAAELKKARIEAASRRFKLQKEFYGEGRITIDRLLEASRFLMEAERDAADSKPGRVQAARDHSTRVRDILATEKSELEAGRATTSDIAEIEQMVLNAEFDLSREREAPEAKPSTSSAKAGSGSRSRERVTLDRERVDLARSLYEEARRLYPSEISLVDFLEAAITLAKAEEDAATSPADRVAAVRAQVDHLKKIVAASETLRKMDQAKHGDVTRARLRLLDAEAHLIDVSGPTSDGVGEGPAPAPGGPMPVPGLGSATSGTKSNADSSSLAKAIAAFNAEALNTPAGRGQPPLTVDEVVAAIRFAESSKDPSISGALLDVVRKVAETRELPPLAWFEVTPLMDPGGDFLFEGWWVRLLVLRGEGVPGGENAGSDAFPIRSRLLHSIPLEEALASAEARANPVGLIRMKGAPSGRRVLQGNVESLKARIERRDRARKR